MNYMTMIATTRRLLTPTFYVGGVSGINPDALVESLPGLEAVLMDLDCCLVTHHGEEVPAAHLDFMAALRDRGIGQCIVSNANPPERVARVQRITQETAHRLGTEILCVTSSMVGGSKKPSPKPFDMAAKLLGVELPHTAHLGDQLLKDTAGANAAGVGVTVLTARYGEEDDVRVKYLQRPVEAALRPVLGLPLRYEDFPHAMTATAA